MKKILSFLLALCLLTLCLPLSALATEEPTDETAVTDNSALDSSQMVLGQTKLIENAKSAFLYERTSKTLMHAWNADERLSPASFVKIMNALVTIENTELSEEVTVTQEVLNSVPSDAMVSKLKAGETFTVEQLLYFLLVDSGNDAAAVLAQHVGGDQQRFVEMMNARAKELGCLNTNFANVHGLHHDEQYMCARDTARILNTALDNPSFRTIFTTVEYDVPATALSPERTITTDNFLLSAEDMIAYYDPRVIGSRTGVNQIGLRGIASVAQYNGMELICVVMDCESEYEDNGATRSYGGFRETLDLLELGFSGYQTAQIFYDGQVLRQAEVYDGDSLLSMGCAASVSAVLPDGLKIEDLDFQYEDVPGILTAPIEKGTLVSTVRVMHGGKCLAQTELYALNRVGSVALQELTIQKGKQGEASPLGAFAWIVIVCAVCVLLIWLFWYIRRKLRKRSKRERHRRRAEQRRRSR